MMIKPTQEHFDYLDELKKTGLVNMFGAGSYLQQDFDLSRIEARDILKEWMVTYGARHPNNP